MQTDMNKVTGVYRLLLVLHAVAQFKRSGHSLVYHAARSARQHPDKLWTRQRIAEYLGYSMLADCAEVLVQHSTRYDLYMIGHGAYSNKNGNPVVRRGIESAVKELVQRTGCKREVARIACRRARGGHWEVCAGVEINGVINATELDNNDYRFNLRAAV